MTLMWGSLGKRNAFEIQDDDDQQTTNNKQQITDQKERPLLQQWNVQSVFIYDCIHTALSREREEQENMPPVPREQAGMKR